eukprot:gene15362-39059_t
MPLGDSITQWHCGKTQTFHAYPQGPPQTDLGVGGYRGPLFQQLQQEWGPYSFETVGGEYGCGSHEGHSGWTCAQLADIITDSAN